jgi:CubicO group peptidase (beta-lactamase class C family)
MKMIRFAGTFILFALLLSAPASGNHPGSSGDQNTAGRLNRYLDSLESRGFSGSVLVEIDGAFILDKGYGLSDRERGARNTPATVFDIGSVTKQFTAAAIMTLEMQGALSVNDSLVMCFPAAPADKAGVTLHQLLRHASGLPSNIGRDYDPIGAQAFVDSVLRQPLRFPPGTRFSYANIGYSLLAMIIEKVSGMPYEEYLYTHLWKPAGMFATGYRRGSRDAIAIGYGRDGNLWGKPTEKPWDADGPFWHLRGNGGILSTTGDLLRWHHALLGDSILSPAAKLKYYHPALRPTETPDSYYAYGWDVHRTPRKTLVIEHNGANGFFYADYRRYVDEGVTIIALMNQMHPNFQDATSEIARVIFDTAYVPPLPVADHSGNRAFTASLMALAIDKGANRSYEAYRNRAPGSDVVEFRVNERGYELLREKQCRQAIEVFRLNTLVFPLSANAFDSLGEAYMSADMKDLAIENYKKSVSLDPGNMNAIEMLETLTGK